MFCKERFFMGVLVRFARLRVSFPVFLAYGDFGIADFRALVTILIANLGYTSDVRFFIFCWKGARGVGLFVLRIRALICSSYIATKVSILGGIDIWEFDQC